MSIWEHGRFRIFNASQHPLRHALSDFSYTNPLLPGVSNPEDALNWVFSVLYPRYIGTFATPGDLPGVASQNDYAIVTNDGTGANTSAGYVYSTVEGVTQWVKRYDMDWSVDSVFAEFMDRTQYKYVHRFGFQDIDSTGAVVVGTYAGQTIYGGNLTNSNLTFNANSLDTTGFVQTDNIFRPTSDNTLNLGTATERWLSIFAGTSVVVSTLTLAGGSITDSTGAISFANENLTTTGSVTATTGVFTTSATIGATLVLATGSITDTGGAISFDNENLSTTGTLASGVHTVSGDLVLAAGSITSVSGAITFANENLSTTGTLGAGDTTVTRLDADNIRIDGNTISVLNLNGNLTLQANGTGVIDAQSAMTTLAITATGVVTVTGQLNADNLRLDANTLSSTNLNGNIILDPNGSGLVEFGSGIFPTTDSTEDIGKSGNVWNKLWIDGSIGGATEISLTTLLSLRDINVGVASGDTIFWDGSKWVASNPDTEITHSELTGLTTGDAGHTQFVMLAGRAGGQTVQGGTAASEDLTLESTAHATKGNIFLKDHTVPFTDATFAVTWQGTDLGDSTHYFRDLYTKGEARGLRLENFTFAGLPAANANNAGRAAWTTDTTEIYIDAGGTWHKVSVNKYVGDIVSTGVEASFSVVVSAAIVDARMAIWQLRDNANDYELIYATIRSDTVSPATTIVVEVSPPLPAGSYRLIGLE